MDARDYYNERFDQDSEPNARHQHVKNTLSRFIEAGSRVLDIGCGSGITTEHIAHLGAKVYGVDYAERRIEYAREHRNHRRITYLAQDVCDLNFIFNFDTIVMVDVLEHIERTRIMDLFNMIHRHTHEGSAIYLNIPDNRFQSFMRDKAEQQPIDEEWSLKEIVNAFKTIGFEPVYLNYFGVASPVEYLEVRFATRGELLRHWQSIYG